MNAEKSLRRLHKLLRAKKYPKALRLVLRPKRGTIKPPFRRDLNHAWFLVGEIHYRMGALRKSTAAFQKALEHWPQDQEALLALADCRSELGQAAEAERLLRGGLEQWSGDAQLTFNLGNALFDQGQYEASIQEYQKTRGDREIWPLAKRNIRSAKFQIKQGR